MVYHHNLNNYKELTVEFKIDKSPSVIHSQTLPTDRGTTLSYAQKQEGWKTGGNQDPAGDGASRIYRSIFEAASTLRQRNMETHCLISNREGLGTSM